jgi:hypothetical protein
LKTGMVRVSGCFGLKDRLRVKGWLLCRDWVRV